MKLSSVFLQASVRLAIGGLVVIGLRGSTVSPEHFSGSDQAYQYNGTTTGDRGQELHEHVNPFGPNAIYAPPLVVFPPREYDLSTFVLPPSKDDKPLPDKPWTPTPCPAWMPNCTPKPTPDPTPDPVPAETPEPGTAVMMLLGSAAAFGWGRRAMRGGK